jgi:DNA-binding transcriptional MerR regulator
MGRGLLIGQVAARAGVSRKALRLYEAAGILPPMARTPAGYRVYGDDALRVLLFVARARRLGLSLAEIKEIVAIKRAGRTPCDHVRSLARRKLEELERRMTDLGGVRASLREVLRRPGSSRGPAAAVCPHIEREGLTAKEGRDEGRASVALPRMRRLPGGRDRR